MYLKTVSRFKRDELIGVIALSAAAFAAALALFYLLLVIPNDSRIELRLPEPAPAVFDDLCCDLTKSLVSARLEMPELTKAGKLLDRYPYKQDYHGLHSGPLNLHLSLGWFPLKTAHRDCIFAPAPSLIEHALALPANPVLKFDYAVISSIEGKLQSGAVFSVTVVDGQTEKTVFKAEEKPLKPYRWRYYEKLYKDFLKYFNPKAEDRDGRWNSSEVSLKEFAGRNVKLRFKTVPMSGGTALSLWGKPCVYDRKPAAARPARSVILVVIDSFNRSHMTPEFSPALYAMAEEGVGFSRALANGNNTKLSVYSFLSSRYPFEMPEMTGRYELSKGEKESFYKKRVPMIAQIFSANGFRSAAVGSVSLFSDGHGLSGDTGFDEAVNLERSGYSPPHVTQETLAWLARHRNEKFFLMVYYYGPHGPYRPPLKYLWRALRTGKAENMRDALYSGDILYHDDYLKRLKEYIASDPALKDTPVVVTSDHGVAFRAAVYDWPSAFGKWKRKKVSYHSHGVSLTPDDLNVPLVFWNAGRKGAVERKVQLLDLAPTLAELAGIKPPGEFRGQSLLGLLEGKDFSEPVTFHQGVTNMGVYWKDEYLYIHNFRPRDGFPAETVVPEEMYGLKQDSACLVNLAVRESPELTVMRRFFNAAAPKDEYSKLVYRGPEGSTATVTLSADGVIDAVETTAVIAVQGRRLLSVEMKSGDEVTLKTAPARAGLRIAARFDGRPASPSEILYGFGALALNTGFEVREADRDYYRGLPPKYKNASPILLFGTFAEENVSSEDLKNSPKQLRSMLEQWGYIN